MRLRRMLSCVFVAMLLFASLPTQPALASSRPSQNHYGAELQKLGKCANTDFVITVHQDLLTLSYAMAGLNPKEPTGAAKLLLQTVVLRQKYEDMFVDPACLPGHPTTSVNMPHALH